MAPDHTHDAPNGERRDGLPESFGFGRADEVWLAHLQAAEAPQPLGAIGRFELLEEISRGGQGIVYRARDTQTASQVAIKRLVAGSFATPSMRRRFDREVDAAESLNHPNIVTIVGVDDADGQRLLAMEWIDGVPITHWAQRDPTGQRDRRLPLDIVKMFIKVCDAVHHAHQRGVIHRDLKPSNILADAAGEPHVLDFGLAKLDQFGDSEEASAVTQTGQYLGTPAYSAPEQVRGASDGVDVRSDVYALGVVLYETLTGCMPYPIEGGLADIFDAIEKTPPTKPSSIIRLDRDLEAILLKTLAKDRRDRYQSVHALGRDLEHYVDGDPIEAKSDRALYVLIKSLRRHRAAVSVAACFAILVVGFSITMAVLYHRAGREADGAVRVQQFLKEMLVSSSPFKTGGDIDILDMLEHAASRIEPELGEYPQAEAGVRLTIAQMYAGFWMWDEAEPHVRIALDIYRDEYGDSSEKLASCLTLLGRSLTFQKNPRAINVQHEALVIRQDLYGEDHPLTAEAYGVFAFALWGSLGVPDIEAAEAHYRKALDIYQRTSLEPLEHWARITYSYGALLKNQNRFEEADAQFAKAVAMYRELAGGDDIYMAQVLSDYSDLMERMGRIDEATAMLRESIAARRKGIGDRYAYEALWRLGAMYHARGDREEALRHYDLTLATRCEMTAERQTEHAPALAELAARLRDHEHDAELYERVMATLRELEPGAVGNLINHTRDLADALYGTGDFAGAETLLRFGVEYAAAELPPTHHLIHRTRGALGACLTAQGEYEAAETELRLAFRSLLALRGRDCPYTQEVAEYLVHFYNEIRSPREAMEFRAYLEPLRSSGG